ncbi:MAG: hypothetical protein ABF290_17445 [Thiogranum sp.]
MSQQGTERITLSVGVTAHRDLLASEVPGIEQCVREFFSSLQGAYPDLPLQLLSPLAEGGDQLAARVAVSMGIPFVAVLPMSQPEYEQDFGDGDRLQEFRELLAQAESTIVLPPVDQSTQSRPVEDERILQYAQLGVFISDHSHVLLALWDGKPGDQMAGTGSVVRYHLTAVMEGFEGDPTPGGLLTDNENDLVHHIVCSRDRLAGMPEDGLKPLQTSWFTSRRQAQRGDDIPEAYKILLERLQRFVRDWKSKQDIVKNNSSSLLNDAPELDLPDGARLTDGLFRGADGLAVHYQRRVQSSLRAIHMLAVLMGLVFLVYSEFDGPGYMVLAFLGLFFAGVAVHVVGGTREWHRKYLDYRALAEGLRVQLYWNLSGVVEKEWAGFAYDNFLLKQDVDLGWIRHVMRQASMHRKRGVSPDERWLPWVIEQWIGQRSDGSGQLAYYSRKEIMNASRFRRTQLLGTMCLWFGIGIALLLFLTHSISTDDQRNSLLVLMGVLPLIAGIWDAYSHKKAEKELIKQYGFMGRIFTKARCLVDKTPEPAFQRGVLKALGQAAMDEGAEWLLMHRERPLEHGRL